MGIAIVLIVVTLCTLFIISEALDAARQRGFEERLIDSATFIKARVQADSLFHEEEALRRLSLAARMPFEIKPDAKGLPLEVQDRLSDRAETFIYRDAQDRLQVYSLFAGGQVFVGRFRGDPRREGFRGGDRRRPEGRRPPGGGWGPGPPTAALSGGWLHKRSLFLLSVIGVPILLVGPAIYFLIRPLNRRINALSRIAERFGEGDLDSRAEHAQSDAFGHLTGTFNRMADQIKGLIDGQNDLLRAVSHELRTPLARLFFVLDDAEDAETPEEKNRQLGRIQKTLTEMNDLVEELLRFVRLDKRDEETLREKIQVEAVLAEMPEVVRDLRGDVRVEIFCGAVQLQAVPRLFRRAVLNLVTNAARYAKSHIWIRASSGADITTLIVDDDGPGVPRDQRERVLKPFLRADESRSSRIGGVGLGLAIVSRIMAIHDGFVEIDDRPEGGARFVLRFPQPS